MRQCPRWSGWWPRCFDSWGREGIGLDVQKDNEEFLTTEKKASANTLSSYLRDVRQFAAYLEREERALDDVTQSDVERSVK